MEMEGHHAFTPLARQSVDDDGREQTIALPSGIWHSAGKLETPTG